MERGRQRERQRYIGVIELAEQGLISLRVAACDLGEKETIVATDASIGGLVRALRSVAAELHDRDVGHCMGRSNARP